MGAATLGGGRRAAVVRLSPDGSVRNRYASILCGVETTKPAVPVAVGGPAAGFGLPARRGRGDQGVVTVVVVHPEVAGPLTDWIRM